LQMRLQMQASSQVDLIKRRQLFNAMLNLLSAVYSINNRSNINKFKSLYLHRRKIENIKIIVDINQEIHRHRVNIRNILYCRLIRSFLSIKRKHVSTSISQSKQKTSIQMQTIRTKRTTSRSQISNIL